MATPVSRNILSVAKDYVSTVSGAKDLVFKPIGLALGIAHNSGRQTRITENVKSLADDASTSLAFAEIGPRIYEAASKAVNFVKAPAIYTLGELASKTSYCAATILKAAEFLGRKGVAMWDTAILKTWGNRFSLVQFSWGILKETENLSRDNPATERGLQEKRLSLIKLAFYVSVFTIVAFGAMISTTTTLGLSTVALASCIGMEFYEKLHHLDLPAGP